MRKAGIVLVTVLALTAAGALVAPAQAVKRPATPGRIEGLAKATRAFVVYSWSSKSTRAVLRTYQRARPGDRWRLVRGPMPARIGDNGFSANRREGDGTTPVGISGSCTASAAAPTRACAGSPTAGCARTRAGRARGPTTTAGSPALHQQTGGPNAGCVSLRHKDLVAVLRWLRPGTRIAMGPGGYLNNRL
jgi:L,D-peptidoglycan transpeptidase YkuD (ErfK/YbiS/YcfS/YnhG family)